MSEDSKPTKSAKTKTKKRWSAPRIVSTRAAFEHAILQCTGLAPPDFIDEAPRSPKGSCTTGGTASS